MNFKEKKCDEMYHKLTAIIHLMEIMFSDRLSTI